MNSFFCSVELLDHPELAGDAVFLDHVAVLHGVRGDLGVGEAGGGVGRGGGAGGQRERGGDGERVDQAHGGRFPGALRAAYARRGGGRETGSGGTLP